MKDSSKKAISLLADLLPPEMQDALKPAVPLNRWKPTAITVVYRETLCLHCGKSHLDTNPLLLLTETHEDGSTRSTAGGVPGPQALPIESTTVDLPPIAFCLDCLDISNPHFLNLAFSKQRAAAANQASGAQRDKAAATNHNVKNFIKRPKDEPKIEEEEEVDLDDVFDTLEEGDIL